MKIKYTKYVLAGYNFDHELRGWHKPQVFDTYDEALEEMRREWEDYQNRYVLDTYEDTDGDDYRALNYFTEDDNETATASSCEYDTRFGDMMIIEPTDLPYVVIVAYENETGHGINKYFTELYRTQAYDQLLVSLHHIVFDMESPMLEADGNTFSLYDSAGFDENYFMIVDCN